MSDWTETKVKLLATLASEGWSAGQIAEKLCTTRNAIIGKLNRLGEKLVSFIDGNSGLEKPPRQYRARKQPWRPPALESSILQSQPYTEPLVGESPEVVGPSKPIVLMALTHRSCRWPVNDGYPEYLFCGKYCDPGPYCTEHRRKAHGNHKS